MFGLRPDGKRVKDMGIIETAGPYFMPMRIDAVNYITIDVPCAALDEFIARERKNGNSYSYMHIVAATLVRLLYLRPKLNRFIMRGTTYQRKGIQISLTVKRKLEDEGAEETLKFEFNGRESLPEIKAIVDKLISDTLNQKEKAKTSGFIGKFVKIPPFMFRWVLAILRWLDKHGMIPAKILKASPFHTSAFLTNLKSIRLGKIYHHLYNFGTTSIFVAMGKEKMMPVVENNKELKIAKIMRLGISLDERIADGFYMGKSLRMMQDIFANLDSLNEALPEGEIPTKIKKSKKKNKKPKKTKAKKVKTEKPKKIKPVKVKKEHANKLFKHAKAEAKAAAEAEKKEEE